MEKIAELFLKIYPIEGVSFKRRVFLHCIFWVIIYLVFWITFVLPSASIQYKILSTTYVFILDITFFYVIIYLIIPCWKSDSYRKYLITLVGFTFLVFFMTSLSYIRVILIIENNWTMQSLSADRYWKLYYNQGFWHLFKSGSLIGYIFETLMTTTPAFFIKLAYSLAKNIYEKKQVEIDYLRSQINPHFLTNTLNNIYSLSVTEDKRNSDAILSLSSLLDYVLYEANQPTISLEKEVSFLSNFIELEKMRNTQRLQISFEVEGNIYGNIPPMILITFVENAFKHSIGDLFSNCFIKIFLKVDDNKLYLEVENSKSNLPINNQRKTFGGIGLTNVKKRLATLFPNTHSLQTINQEDLYLVKLQLELI